jgi:hypothetical protein
MALNLAEYNGFMDVTCITRKRKAIFTSFMSQLAPSEATVMRQPGQGSHSSSFTRPDRYQGHSPSMHMPLIGGYRVLVLQFGAGRRKRKSGAGFMPASPCNGPAGSS